MKKLGEIYIIGVNHAVQWDHALPATVDYMQYLEKQIKRFNIDLVAEEFSEEALRWANADHTTSNQVSIKLLNKSSVLCDPDDRIREIVGYPTQAELEKKFGTRSVVNGTDEYKKRREYEKDFFPIREKYWLDQLKNLKHGFRKVIFICGSEHLTGFRALLEKNGYSVIILDKKFDAV